MALQSSSSSSSTPSDSPHSRRAPGHVASAGQLVAVTQLLTDGVLLSSGSCTSLVGESSRATLWCPSQVGSQFGDLWPASLAHTSYLQC
ncbi:hypothetical protein E2C01_012553 [Portunus trituberculatus]|uniref:Uncharacterized protein n=1 Tax=Portunus trituberculatus TaxID=210409 RepID=A0A5B7DE68_PORTR|nr:hypothetical protein [Portunus trituberculatus]